MEISNKTLFGTRLDHGHRASRAYVEEAVTDANEWSLEIRLDREKYQAVLHLSQPFVLGSSEGTAHRAYPLSVLNGVDNTSHAGIATQLGVQGAQSEELKQTISKIFSLFLEKDALTLEATVSTSRSGTGVWCSSGRLTVDDAASKRQQELFSQRDTDAEVPEEVEAEKYSLVYVKLPGSIGTVVNGAGLAMATNDAIAHHGGASANFLDTGGQATVETMTKAFGIILGDQRVRAILVNIYGGIIRCDMIAQSIISTARSLGPLRVPVVVRLQGTNSEEGLGLLEEADLGMHIESDFGRAASRAVQLAGGS
ncbi:succinyl-CoA synthetase-like protein [Plectosphaerella plurivora]|uniref:Succinyl-CoA synthetase-like protein n=1 Tax=Plectosphaerella plurivora TaxID=936078 RepID=A0A9P9AF80_9PEZI|nr:succinyl-CoA synthetase-like protein [Plectosphaerella plurivora]